MTAGDGPRDDAGNEAADDSPDDSPSSSPDETQDSSSAAGPDLSLGEYLPVNRREFMQLGLLGGAIESDLLDLVVDTAYADTASDGSTRNITRSSTRPTPSDRRDYFPIVSEAVSVHGLPRQTAHFSRTLPDGRLSIRHRAAPLQFEPLSVRELLTPQTTGTGPTANPTTWTNWLGDYANSSALEIDIGSGSQRRKLVESVNTYQTLHYRGVGSGHSHSEAARPETYFTDVKSLSGLMNMPSIRPPDDDFWDEHDVERDHLVRVKAGTVLKDLNRNLLSGTGLALPNMGSWDGQTLAGAINTSTHGTGLGLGTFADLVRAVEVITVPESQLESGRPLTRMLRIEPTDGVTDPETFAQNGHDHYAGLVQNDDLFHSVVVGYGSMGIVHSYILELRDSYWLHEDNWISQWGGFDPVHLADTNRHFNFLVDLIEPQLTGTTSPRCLLRTRNVADANGRSPTERANVANAIEQHVNDMLDSWKDIDNVRDAVNAIEDTYEELLSIDILSLAGYDPPFVGGRHESAWYIALRRKKDTDPNKIPPEPPMDAITTEVAVPLDKLGAAVDRVIQFVQNNYRFFPAPLGVRFTDGSPHVFSPEYERPTAMLEFIIPQPDKLQQEFDAVDIKKDGNLLKPGTVYVKPKKIFYQKLKKISYVTGRLKHFLEVDEARKEMRKIEQSLVRSYGGRPHMGKSNTVDTSSGKPYMRPQNMYPEYDKWLDAQTYLGQFGTFDGEFTRRKT